MGQFLIDGCREIEAAARCGVSIRTLFATQSSALSFSSGLRSNVVLVGESFSTADISLYAYTHVAEEGGFDLSSYPAILRWLSRVQAQPGYCGMQ